MNTRMPKQPRLALTLVVLSGVITTCGQPRQGSPGGGDIRAPAHLVAEYLARDSRGERLRPAPWFRLVSAWEDEPAWDAMTLIRSFRVGQGSIEQDSARIEVTYDVVGTLEGTPEGLPMKLVPRQETQRVEFVLSRAQGHWVVASPSINPHVLADSILAYRPGIMSREQSALLDSLLRTTHH